MVFLIAVGEVLEGVAADKARASIRALADLVPKTAILEENGATRKVDAATLQIGQRVLVRPGSRIPADGEIAEGTSGVDESPVTDESMPKTKGPGDPVFAGSINAEAVLRITVNRPGFAGDQIIRLRDPIEGVQVCMRHASSASAGGIFPMGSSRRRWLNQSTQLRVSVSTSSAVRHDLRLRMTPVL